MPVTDQCDDLQMGGFSGHPLLFEFESICMKSSTQSQDPSPEKKTINALAHQGELCLKQRDPIRCVVDQLQCARF